MKRYLIVFSVFIFVFGGGFLLGVRLKKSPPFTVLDTLVKVKTDTIILTKIKKEVIKEVVFDTIKIAFKDTLKIRDTLYCPVPIEHKTAVFDRAKVHYYGYRAGIDSVEFLQQSVVNQITFKPKPKRWGVGIYTGVGIGKSGIQPQIGIGVTYNFWKF